MVILAASGGYFLYRANVARPQVLSIIFVLWSIMTSLSFDRSGDLKTTVFFSSIIILMIFLKNVTFAQDTLYYRDIAFNFNNL